MSRDVLYIHSKQYQTPHSGVHVHVLTFSRIGWKGGGVKLWVLKVESYHLFQLPVAE